MNNSAKNLKLSVFGFTQTEGRSLGILASIYSLRMLGLFMILPVFSLYAYQLIGGTPVRVGIALGIYGLTQAMFQIPLGYLSDRLGRKPVIMIGLVLFGLGSLIAALSNSIDGVILGRALQGMGAIGSVIMALLSDLTREEVRLRAMACIGITIGFSFGLSFVLGPIFSAGWGLQGIFWMTSFLATIALGVVMWILPNQTHQKQNQDNHRLKVVQIEELSETNAESKMQLLHLYLGVLILHASLTALFLKIPQALTTFNFEANQSWQFYLPVFLASLLITIPWIVWMEKSKQTKISFRMAIICLILSEIGMGFYFNSMWGFALSLCLFFAVFNVLEASLPSFISKLAAKNKKGTALGIFSALQFLGLFLGGSIGGVLDNLGGWVTVLGFCIILALSWFLLMFKWFSLFTQSE